MTLIIRLDIYLITTAIITLLLVRVVRENQDQRNIPQRLYFWMLLSSLAAELCEALTWGLAGNASPAGLLALQLTNALVLILQAIPTCLWALYVNFKIHDERRAIIRGFRIWSLLVIANALLVVSSPLTSWVWSISPDGQLVRGPAYLAVMFLTFIPLAYATVLVLAHHAGLPARVFGPLIFFGLPPFLGALLETIFPQLSIAWAAVSLSLLTLYISLQNQQAHTDYLTGLYNRRYLDNFLEERLKFTNGMRMLGLIMIDLDHFKQINDQYGHLEGDRAIETVAKLLRRCMHHEDLIARYAGDEFVVVCEVADQAGLEAILSRLRRLFDAWNQETATPWKLAFSSGAVLTTARQHTTGDQLIQQADFLMYENKQRRNKTHT